MKKFTLLLIVIILSAVITMPSYSGLKKTAQTGLQFLKIDVGARPSAMGGAFMMVGNDANALFFNPAGIAAMNSSTDIFLSRTDWVVGVKYNSAAVVQNFGNWGNAGISIISSDYGDILGTRVSSTQKGYVETGNLDVSAYALGVAYARQFTDKFTMGGQVKYAKQHLGESLLDDGRTVQNEVSNLAYDFGTLFYPGFKSFGMGMNIRNFSPQVKFQNESFELPLTFYLGFSMDVLDFIKEEHPTNSLVLELDAIHPRDYPERIHLGSEYWFKDMLALRAGYKFNYDEESFSAGFGVKGDFSGINIKLDYSYSDMGIFDSVNRISVGFTIE